MKLWEPVQLLLHRALLTVGALPTLLSLVGAGVLLAWQLGQVAWLLLSLFGVLASAEAFHRQQKAHLVQRRQAQGEPLLWQLADAQPHWQPKVLQEFEHGGLRFRAAGFDQLPVALAVTPPLCPRCAGHLTERRELRRPGLARIRHFCGCGFTQASKYTLGELQHEARQMAGCPE